MQAVVNYIPEKTMFRGYVMWLLSHMVHVVLFPMLNILYFYIIIILIIISSIIIIIIIIITIIIFLLFLPPRQ